jgi:hypothetical protein
MTGKPTGTGWLRYWPGLLFTALLGYWPRLLFVIPLAAVLWVPSYNRIEPELAGIPFFYWYQLALIVVGALLVLVVYIVESRFTRVTEELDAKDAPGDIL